MYVYSLVILYVCMHEWRDVDVCISNVVSWVSRTEDAFVKYFLGWTVSTVHILYTCWYHLKFTPKCNFYEWRDYETDWMCHLIRHVGLDSVELSRYGGTIVWCNAAKRSSKVFIWITSCYCSTSWWRIAVCKGSLDNPYSPINKTFV